ncbi:MAG TPA: peptidyl-prolyl cis-trans isomerase [Bryobacteraceae bacterium]|nr:peptidyl-prolyl cis-trans isomerase [Bryobacteraceae bacterium]
MFDLFRSRDKAVRLLLGALLVLVALSMLTYLIPSYGTADSANDVIVAEVGKDQVTLPEVQRLIQNTMRGKQLPPDILPNYIPQMVQQLVTDRAMAYEAQRLGFQVTDADVRDAIQQIAPSLFPDGKFVGKEAYADLLAQQNLSIAEFESDVRRQILATRLREVAVEGTVVSPQEIEQEYRKRNEKIKIQYVKIPSDKYRTEVQPTPAEMQQYFKANTARYQIPESKNLAILIADQTKLEQGLTPSDAVLQQIYNQNKDQFRTPERVKVRHILLKTTGKAPAEDAQIKAKAEDILKQIKAGGDFAALAKKYSEDTGSAQNGGQLPDWITRGQTVPEFERVAFSLPIGQTSDLVKTQYGYHIIQVLQKEQAHLQSFDDVKAQLAAQWKRQQVNDMMQKISDQAQAALQKDPQHPEKVADSLHMQLVQAKDVGPSTTIPEVGPSPEFAQSIAQLKQGEVSQPVVAGGNKLVLAVVTGVNPAHPQSFDEVENQVREAMVQSRLALAVQKHAQELVDKAKAMGGDLEKAAKAAGLDVKTSDEFTRLGSVNGVGSASYLSDGFSHPDGSLFGPITMPDGTVVAKVIAHVEPDMSKLAEQRSSIRDEIKSRKAQDRNSLFEAGLRDEMIRQGKIKIHQEVINRLINNYKS